MNILFYISIFLTGNSEKNPKKLYEIKNTSKNTPEESNTLSSTQNEELGFGKRARKLTYKYKELLESESNRKDKLRKTKSSSDLHEKTSSSNKLDDSIENIKDLQIDDQKSDTIDKDINPSTKHKQQTIRKKQHPKFIRLKRPPYKYKLKKRKVPNKLLEAIKLRKLIKEHNLKNFIIKVEKLSEDHPKVKEETKVQEFKNYFKSFEIEPSDERIERERKKIRKDLFRN
ncbi:hypothetical protein TUBRATIS_15910 [Tubulinosema ratisbonensis]|uniref:Uncharacterized protein n=1 Tax=Tubulinosema ratisbonensis TaxID=291195 RepID=A0A437ALH3_9MICR|nr:hypothetical protein TUBRATIS_15910 [Tubulinosema ratisbonensis]